jgi:hypothetical protein
VACVTGKPRNMLLGKLVLRCKNQNLLQRLLQVKSRDSLVGRMNGYEMDNPGFESRQVRVAVSSPKRPDQPRASFCRYREMFSIYCSKSIKTSVTGIYCSKSIKTSVTGYKAKLS